MENTIGEYGDKKAFIGQHDSPVSYSASQSPDITTPALDAEEMYQVGTVGYHNGGTTIVPSSQPNMTNSGTDLNITASEENRSAKYKNPNVKQSTSQMPGEPSGDEPSI